MGSTLVVAEKPAVGMALSKVLGARNRQEGFMEGNGWLVSWCIGHLVELAPADAYDPRYSKWIRTDLPIIPEPWQYQVLAATKKQFDILSALMRDNRVDSLVCATDAGREGELIFRLTYNLCGCNKPVKRLWISSMEESAIRKGFENLADSVDFDRLYDAALCRAKADWLIGINGTRLFTTLYNGRTLNVGRVMTPTLALITERESAIGKFQKEKFYTVELDLQEFRAASGKFSSQIDAENLRSACLGKSVVVQSITRKDKTVRPPKLYDLTTLQREANRLLNFTTQQTLDCLQSLYEKRLATYPRTDSRYLTEDMEEGLPSLCQAVANMLPFMQGHSLPINTVQVIDSSKVSDHHAIIPTAEVTATDLNTLSPGERSILDLISVRLICAVGEPHSYAETTAIVDCGGASFAAKGRTATAEGWKAAEKALLSTLKQNSRQEEPPLALPPLTEGQQLNCVDVLVKEGITAPPARFTEDTLLSAMEHASAEDFAKLKDVERKGLGTSATRAATIEKLVRCGFVERKKKQLIPTEKGMALVQVMPDQLKSAKLTAEWEERLGAVERGELSSEKFMAGITEMLSDLVQTYQDAVTTPAASMLSDSGRTKVGVCPRCGKNVVEGQKSFFCEGYYDHPSCGFALWKDDRFFTRKKKKLTSKIAAALLKNGRVRVSGLFSEKNGTTYAATIVLNDDGGKFVRYKLEFEGEKR